MYDDDIFCRKVCRGMVQNIYFNGLRYDNLCRGSCNCILNLGKFDMKREWDWIFRLLL